ncbi:hypothetical protein Barb4_01173 [Bacteroidales bacterium Barb4]|nr:hypothetical protein Barb4_01173 [Bacteroidales bacterium Barb4]
MKPPIQTIEPMTSSDLVSGDFSEKEVTISEKYVFIPTILKRLSHTYRDVSGQPLRLLNPISLHSLLRGQYK